MQHLFTFSVLHKKFKNHLYHRNQKVSNYLTNSKQLNESPDDAIVLSLLNYSKSLQVMRIPIQTKPLLVITN